MEQSPAQTHNHTLIIGGIVLVIVLSIIGLFFVAQKKPAVPTPIPSPTQSALVQGTPRPTITPAVATALLSIEPQTVTVKKGQKGSVSIVVNSGENHVSVVQVELSYDPKVIGNVTVTKGTFFPQATELDNRVDQAKGRISFAIGVDIDASIPSGTGTVATLAFSAIGEAGSKTSLTFLPKSMVNDPTTAPSVLKETTGATIQIGQ